MRCPVCGTLVPDGLGVCPACHVPLDVAPPSEVDESRWCKSCGSPVPPDLRACPVCGMPVDGAFDDEDEPVVPVAKEEPKEGGAQGFISAIPPIPKSGGEAEDGEARSLRMRLALYAVVSALVLVGGTALFITRPWDPNAYATHATEDADTSMEGFPGEVTHLVSQDFVEDEELRELAAVAASEVEAYASLLEQVDEEAEGLHAPLVDFVETGRMPSVEQGLRQVRELKARLDESTVHVKSLEFIDERLSKRRDELLARETSVAGEMGVLVDAWVALEAADAPSTALREVREKLEGAEGGRSYDEWHELFGESRELY